MNSADLAVFATLAGSLLLLWKGADWLVTSASRIAQRLGVSDLVIGMTVVALGTSAPEAAVTLQAAWEGHASLAIGNVIGSNIFNLGLILGLCAVIWPMPTRRRQIYRSVFALIVAAVLIAVLISEELGRGEALFVLALLCAYFVYVVTQDPEEPDRLDHLPLEASAWSDSAKLVVGLGAILFGSTLLIDSAKHIASAAGVSDFLIGMTVVAAGTSLPELVTSLLAGVRGRFEMMVGTLIGSDLFNFGVLCVAAILNPLAVDAAAQPALGVMVASLLLLVVLMRSGWRLSRVEGALIAAIALLRWGYLLVPGAS